jgi:DinB superfamily
MSQVTISSEDRARARAREYFATNGTQASAAQVHERVAAAFSALDAALAGVGAAQASCRTIAGEWSAQEIVDHLLETHRPGMDELRCLLAGQRPPGEPIPAALQSKAPRLRPWSWLLDELRRVHREILDLLAAIPADAPTTVAAPIVMVVNVPGPDGAVVPLHWVEDLDWKAYAIVWRLHAIDHLKQLKKVLAAGERT